MTKINSSALSVINHIVAVGSVDGVCTAAAMLRNAAPDCTVEFTQAFSVDKIDVSTWKPNSKVAFVDLAVDHSNASTTNSFIFNILNGGHSIVAVCDEHDSELWLYELATYNVHPSELLIEPVSQKTGSIKSSGALLASVLVNADEQTLELCRVANLGDMMQFEGIGQVVNEAVKSAIADSTRRVYLANHFAFNSEPDEKIIGWMKEYEGILATHAEILDSATLSDSGILSASSYGKKVDVTTLMKTLYAITGVKVLALHGQTYDKSKGGVVETLSFGAPQGSTIDLLAPLQAAGLPAMGFAQKASVPMEYATEALQIVEALLD